MPANRRSSRSSRSRRVASGSKARPKASSLKSKGPARRGAKTAPKASTKAAPKIATAQATPTKRPPPPSAVAGTPSTPAQYLASLPLDRREILQALHDAICATAPSLEPHLCGRILGFGRYHYKYASGREGDWFVVGLASQKSYISLFLCACDKNGYLAEQNARRLGNVSVGKSCIRFKRIEDLNVGLVLDLVRQAEALAKASGGFAM
jgi:hypothetical protein